MNENSRETGRRQPEARSRRSVQRRSLGRYTRAEFLSRLIEAGILKRDTEEGEEKDLQAEQAVCRGKRRKEQKPGGEVSR